MVSPSTTRMTCAVRASGARGVVADAQRAAPGQQDDDDRGREQDEPAHGPATLRGARDDTHAPLHPADQAIVTSGER